MSEEMAWRVSFIVPGIVVMLCSFATYFLAEDSPKVRSSLYVGTGMLME